LTRVNPGDGWGRSLLRYGIEQGTAMFKGSTHEDDWVIYHDRLAQWWSAEGQAYLASKGFAHRQWKFLDAASRKVSQYYKWTLCGDSPE
jgi:hypothetical protein